MSTVGKGLNRVGEIGRMFLASGARVDDARVKIYVDETSSIPDRYFSASVRRSMQVVANGFAPSIGEIFASYRALDSAGAETVAREAAPSGAKLLPGGEIDWNPWHRRVPTPNRSHALPSGTGEKFAFKQGHKTHFYVNAAWDASDGISPAKEKFTHFHRLSDRCRDLATCDLANDADADVAEFARRVWDRHRDECKRANQNANVFAK